MSVVAAKVVVAFENTQPLIVPENEPAVWDIVTAPLVDPARMLPSKVITALGLIVASPPTIQKMLSGFAPLIRLNVMAPLKVRFPGAWMMKIALTSCWALNVKVMPVVDEVPAGKLYNVLPKRIWLVDRPVSAVAPVQVHGRTPGVFEIAICSRNDRRGRWGCWIDRAGGASCPGAQTRNRGHGSNIAIDDRGTGI